VKNFTSEFQINPVCGFGAARMQSGTPHAMRKSGKFAQRVASLKRTPKRIPDWENEAPLPHK
jgi:hypothetical protein